MRKNGAVTKRKRKIPMKKRVLMQADAILYSLFHSLSPFLANKIHITEKIEFCSPILNSVSYENAMLFFRVLLFVTALLFPICKPESKRIPSKDEKCGQHSYDLWSLLLETYRSAFFLISLFLTVNLCSFVFSMISYSLPPFRRLAFSFFC